MSRSIDVEDSEAILRAIRLTPQEQPIDMMLHTPGGLLPAAISDEMLVMADVSHKARLQVAYFVGNLLLKHMPKAKAGELAVALSEGRWTHDFPITVQIGREMGLPIKIDMPQTIYELMDLYPQAGTGRPSVIYVPLRRTPSPRAEPAGQQAPAETPAKK